MLPDTLGIVSKEMLLNCRVQEQGRCGLQITESAGRRGVA